MQGRYLLHGRTDGEIVEVFSVAPQHPGHWMASGDCRILSVVFGRGRNVGLAWVTSQQDQAAPKGTRLQVHAFDWDGQPAEELPPLAVTGEQTALNPWRLDEPRLIRLCLDVPEESGSNFRLALIAIGAKATPRSVQYATESLSSP